MKKPTKSDTIKKEAISEYCNDWYIISDWNIELPEWNIEIADWNIEIVDWNIDLSDWNIEIADW